MRLFASSTRVSPPPGHDPHGGREDELDRLPADARARLDVFATALERIHVDDLILHVDRRPRAAHRRVAERAALVARQAGLEDVIDAARRVIVDAVIREFATAQLRIGTFAMNSTANLGPADDRERILRSLADVVSALVLGDRLDEHEQAELLGLWGRLLP
jgi:hypothetical protein